MEKIPELVRKIRLTGATLELVDGKIMYLAPKGYTSEDREVIKGALRQDKPGLLAYLASEREVTHGPDRLNGAQQRVQAPETGATSPVAPAPNAEAFDSYEVESGVFLHSPRTSDWFLQWRESWRLKERKDERPRQTRTR